MNEKDIRELAERNWPRIVDAIRDEYQDPRRVFCEVLTEACSLTRQATLEECAQACESDAAKLSAIGESMKESVERHAWFSREAAAIDCAISIRSLASHSEAQKENA